MAQVGKGCGVVVVVVLLGAQYEEPLAGDCSFTYRLLP